MTNVSPGERWSNHVLSMVLANDPSGPGRSYLRPMHRKFLGIAAIIQFLAVVAGAFGAHGLKPHLAPDQLESWRTAVSYQFYHGLAILLLASCGNLLPARTVRLACWLFIGGVMLFSGSLYLLSTSDLLNVISTKIVGPLTPLGGLLFLAGWALVAHGAFLKTH